VRLDRIAILDYDPAWPLLFGEQRERLETVLQPWLVGPIEHIGSTSVPGLPAKPIIDMLARVHDYDRCEGMLPRLAEVGWLSAPEPGDAAERKRSVCYPRVEYRSHHLHVVEQRWAGWPTLLAFRDHLRGCAEDRDAYARIKRQLAALDDQDRPAYRAGKAPFITEVLRKLSTT